MQPKEIFQLAMAKQEVPRMPFIETSIAFKLSEIVLGRKLKPLQIPQLGLMARNIEDEKELARLLGRTRSAFDSRPPLFVRN